MICDKDAEGNDLPGTERPMNKEEIKQKCEKM